MSDDERSAQGRAAAEQALAQLLEGSVPSGERLIVLGGLVPPTLARSGPPDVPAHLGTSDVDVLLVTHLTTDDDRAPIEAALFAMRFRPDADGWRWRGMVDRRLVKIEFLCDLDDQPAEALVAPAGCQLLRAVNLRGTGHVARDHREYTISTQSGAVRVRIAGLGGYLFSKAASARARGADKDYYDLVYVLLHNRAGGPQQAAELILNGPLAEAIPSLQTTFVEIRERYRTDRAHGAQAYAREALKVTPDESVRLLAADAAAAVNEFLDALGC